MISTMRIPRFYCPELTPDLDVLPLSDAAHRHAVQVLRLKQGDHLAVFDGQGLEYQAVLEQISKRQSTIKLLEQVVDNKESPLKITLLQSISRGERMDYALQKAVELGVTRIIPVITERCNVQLSNGRADKRWAHWRGVMISACEQSGRSVLPELEQVTSLDEVLNNSSLQGKIVLEPLAENSFSSLGTMTEVSLLIGPEGGFSEQELVQIQAAAFQSVQFGPRILRTETATAASLAVIQTLWGDLN